jgi:hypothetical protein
VVYVVESSDEAILSEAARQAGLLLRGQYPDAKVEAIGESIPPNYRATMTISAPAQPITASRYADVVDTIPVALQVGEHIYGIAFDSNYQVLRDGETVAEAASPAEAFGRLFGVARQDLWETLHPVDDPSDVTLLNLDHDFIAGLLPSLLDSPAVQGKAADELIKFFETATLQIAPEEDELPPSLIGI